MTLSLDEQDVLRQARQRTFALLEALERSRAQLADPKWSLDELASAEGQSAYSAAIDAARGTLDNLDRALNSAEAE
jgi:hypothetical protein